MQEEMEVAVDARKGGARLGEGGRHDGWGLLEMNVRDQSAVEQRQHGMRKGKKWSDTKTPPNSKKAEFRISVLRPANPPDLGHLELPLLLLPPPSLPRLPRTHAQFTSLVPSLQISDLDASHRTCHS